MSIALDETSSAFRDRSSKSASSPLPVTHNRRSLALTAALLFAFALPAETQVVGGTIGGIVTDPSGAVVPHAKVVIHNDDTGTERRLETDQTGHFAAPSMSIGAYTVTVEAAGFSIRKRTGIALAVGQALQVDSALTVETQQEITVQDQPATVNLSTQQTSGLVSERQVKDLPLNGRSYDQLITLNPATVNYTAQRSGSVGTSNSSVGNMFAVSGRRPQDNLYLLNGIEYTGASLINVTPGVECRSLAISAVTLKPGNWPPSPGLAPCAILISISRHAFRYSAVTPKRPDAICLMADEALSPFSRGLDRSGSSPPSPESDRAPILFIAIDNVSCASGLSAPREIPGASRRFLISVMLSTSSTDTGTRRSRLKSSRSRNATGGCRRTASA